ncbi:hypothetical protein DB30_00905 [Enhygromyxa salina]|uniref:Uncharacterized protein n=1 Tax=Enhygromyxa salina TaxID=215803 RepID=A0A0C1Z5R4_9BACT|nr:hypothetical protein DB30_00905 [Enhygromyxa salina]
MLTCILGLACVSDPSAEDSETSGSDSSDSSDSSDTAEPEGGRCDPAAAAPCAGAGTQMCCSDDPAAVSLEDLAASVTPAYLGRGGEGTPIFSGGNNGFGRSGTCVTQGSIPPAVALADPNAEGCPVPCNPTWSASQISATCGPAAACCQAQALETQDCAFDPMLGDAGCWRPVTGGDIVGLGGADASNWSAGNHATHQDPGGAGCEAFVNVIPQPVLDGNGITAPDVLFACFRRLSVANQRGYCRSGGVDACDVFADPCAAMNEAEARTGCG